MSRLDELIAELCPDGVEYFRLQDVFEIRNGYTPSRSNPAYWENGTVPWFRLEDIRSNGRTLSDSIQHITQAAVKGDLFPENSIIMATSATIGEHAMLTVDALANQRFTVLSRKRNWINELDPKFVYYYCFILGEWCRNNVNMSGFASVDMKKYKSFKFPFPPLPVQQEIVRILDKFTELEAELEARKKQYEHYRKSLLECSNATQWYKLEELFSMKAGKSINASDIALEKNKEHAFPCYGGNGLRGYVNKPSHHGKFAIIGRQGALCGNVKRVAGAFYATEHAVVVEAKPHIDIDWAYHMLTAMNLNQYATKSAQPGLSVKRIAAITIPVPPLEEQKRIAAILDRFDALVNDITQGLPAEIAARRKQYEYYRDKLLTFKEKAQ